MPLFLEEIYHLTFCRVTFVDTKYSYSKLSLICREVQSVYTQRDDVASKFIVQTMKHSISGKNTRC